MKCRDAFWRSSDPGQGNWGPSMTDPSQQRECDVNVIIARFLKTGVLPDSGGVPQYGDFSHVPPLLDRLEIQRHANDAFLALPDKVRSKFGNDPVAFVEFCADPKNAKEMADLGLLSPEAEKRVLEAFKANSAPGGGGSATVAPPKGPASTGASEVKRSASEQGST